MLWMAQDENVPDQKYRKGVIPMPPSGFTRKAVLAATQFVGACYEDLLEEVRSGKHASIEEALEHEIGRIEKALAKAHITPEGELIER